MRLIFTLSFLLIFAPGFAQDNWVTIYEAGNDTDSSLYDTWGSIFRYESDENGPNVTNTMGGIYQFNQGVELLYYSDNFGAGICGITKVIPNMENYSSLRIYLSAEIADSVGTPFYATMINNGFDEYLGAYIWENFAEDQNEVVIPFDNSFAHNALFLYANLNRGDSVSVFFNYVRIEADTTQLNNEVSAANFLIYSSGSTLFIESPNETDTYSVEIFNTSGNSLFYQSYAGNQIITPLLESGIYFVRVVDVYGNITQNSVYIE